MPILGTDLQHGKLHVDPWGRLWCAGWNGGTVYIEMASHADLTCETLVGDSHRKPICTAEAHQPGIAVRHDGAIYVEVAEGGALSHYRIANLSAAPVRIDTT